MDSVGLGGFSLGETFNEDISDAHCLAIGRIADAWAELDINIDMMLWHLLGVQQKVGACVTAQIISTIPRLSALRSLVVLRGGNDTLVGRLGAWAGEIERMATKRNRTVHDKRFTRERTNEVFHLNVTARKEVTFYLRQEEISELKNFRTQIIDKIIEFESIRDLIFEQFGASPYRLTRSMPRLRPTHRTQQAHTDSTTE